MLPVSFSNVLLFLVFLLLIISFLLRNVRVSKHEVIIEMEEIFAKLPKKPKTKENKILFARNFDHVTGNWPSYIYLIGFHINFY